MGMERKHAGWQQALRTWRTAAGSACRRFWWMGVLALFVAVGVTACCLLLPLHARANRADEALAHGDGEEALAGYFSVIEGENFLSGALSERAVAGVLSALQQLLDGGEAYAALLADGTFERAAALFGEAGATEQAQSLNDARQYALARQLEADGALAEAAEAYRACGGYLEAGEAEQRCLDGVVLAEARAAFDGYDFVGAETLLLGVSDAARAQAQAAQFAAERDAKLGELAECYAARLGAGAWYTVLLGEQGITVMGDARYSPDALPDAADAVFAGLFGALFLRDGRVTAYGDTLGAAAEMEAADDVVSAAMGLTHALLLHRDGTVTAVGSGACGEDATESWTDVRAVAAGAFHSVGLRSDGTAVATGSNAVGQCDVGEWADIVSIAAGLNHTVGLRSDGTVVAVGDNACGQCNVADWSNVIGIACGGNHTLALTADWRVLATGDNGAGQCDVGNWTDVVAVAGGLWHTVCVRADGRLVTAGTNDNGQCPAELPTAFAATPDGTAWETTHLPATEVTFVADRRDGPWLYASNRGAVSIAVDDAYSLAAARADLFCTAGTTPTAILSGGGEKAAMAAPGPRLARQNSAVFAITGDFYFYGTNPDGIKMRYGQIYDDADGAQERGLAFFPDGTMRLVDPETTTAADLLAIGVQDCWTFGPVLVEQGRVGDIEGHRLVNDYRYLRSAIGTVGAHHHIAVTTGTGTLRQLAQLFVDYGCSLAYNLDGGRSVSMAFMGESVNRSYYEELGASYLRDMVGFLQSDLVPGPYERYYNRAW